MKWDDLEFLHNAIATTSVMYLFFREKAKGCSDFGMVNDIL